MATQFKEKLPTVEGGEKAKKIWEEARKKKPSSDLIEIIKDSQISDKTEDEKKDRVARGPKTEKTL